MTQNLNLIVWTSVSVFLIGFSGIFFKRRLIISILLSLELTVLGSNLLWLISSTLQDDMLGVTFVFYCLCVAAAESAIGLSLVLVWYRLRNSVRIEFLNQLNG